jgi:hypothetical protein
VVVFLVTSTAWQRVATIGRRWIFSWPHPPLGSGWLRLDDGGYFPGHDHRLAAGGYDWMTVDIFLATSTAWQRMATIGRRWIFSWPLPPLIRSHRSPDGGYFPGHIHRLAAGGYDGTTVDIFLATTTAWQRVATIGRRWIFSWPHPPLGSGWLRLDDGGDFPGHYHRLAAGGYDWTTVDIFLATSTAWQRVATMGVADAIPQSY